MKKAFSLFEMLIVVGIIGILAAVLLVSMSGASESASAAKCLANMHQLALGCQSRSLGVQIGADNNEKVAGVMPAAGSFDKWDYDGSIIAVQGWIGWTTCGEPGGKYISTYSADKEARHFCLTNGTLWKYVGSSSEVYVCPGHRKVVRKSTASSRVPMGPCWSYVMNAAFYWHEGNDGKPYPEDQPGVEYLGLARADRILLFAELPFEKIEKFSEQQSLDFSTNPDTPNDPILQYQNCDGEGNEIIGFNHKLGKRDYCAHVVFADAHTERLKLPMASGSADSKNLRDLTMWLCCPTETGKAGGAQIDVSLTGNKYEAISD